MDAALGTLPSMDEAEGKAVTFYPVTEAVGQAPPSSSNYSKTTVPTKDESENGNGSHVKEESMHAKLIKKRTLLLNKLNTIENQKYFARRYTPLPPSRPKVHWDFVLEEVQWMALDFRQELRYKHAYCQAIAGACVEHMSQTNHDRQLIINEDARRSAGIISQRMIDTLRQLNDEPLPASYPTASAAIPDSTFIAGAAIEKILSIPSAISLAASNAAVRAPRAMSLLLAHQHNVVTHINQVGALGFGALVFGKPFTGKTVAVLCQSLSWMDSVSGAEALDQRPFLVVFAAHRAIPKWLSTARQHFHEEYTIVLWSLRRDFLSDPSCEPSKKLVLLVCLEDLEAFRAFLHHPSHLSLLSRLKGWIVDVRASITLVDSSSGGGSPLMVQVEVTEKARCKQHLQLIAETLQALRSTPRLVVSDTSLLALDRLAVLSVLIPGATYSKIMAKLHAGAGAPPDSISQSALSQSLVNLSTHVNMSTESVTLANAQIREEIVSVELTPQQQLKYDELSTALVKSSYYDGSDIDQLARVTALLKLLCFHEGFATMKRIPQVKPQDGGGPAAATTLSSPFWSYRPTYSVKSSNTAAAQAAAAAANPTTAIQHLNIKTGICFYPGKLVKHLNKPYDYNSLYDEDLAMGSNKLEFLKSLLLQRFNGLRVVVTASTWSELLTAHYYLLALGIAHLFPYLYLKEFRYRGSNQYGDAVVGEEEVLMDSLMLLEEERNVQAFNNPAVLSNILLATSSVFKSPCSSPWLADAVIVLSHDFDVMPDYKSCFRLRLLHAGPSGDPVTIVRVCSKRTLEEVILRQKTSLHRLRGCRLSDLHFNIKDYEGAGVGGAMVGSSSSSLANIFFLKKAPSARSPMDEEVASVASSTTSTLQGAAPPQPDRILAVPSPPVVPSVAPPVVAMPAIEVPAESPVTVSEEPTPRRGGGKGTIVLGPQGKTTFIKSAFTSEEAPPPLSLAVVQRVTMTSAQVNPSASATTPLSDKSNDADWAQVYARTFRDALAELSMTSLHRNEVAGRSGGSAATQRAAHTLPPAARQRLVSALLQCCYSVLWTLNPSDAGVAMRRLNFWYQVWVVGKRARELEPRKCKPLSALERLRLRSAGFGLSSSEERLGRLLCTEQLCGAAATKIATGGSDEEISAPVGNTQPGAVPLQSTSAAVAVAPSALSAEPSSSSSSSTAATAPASSTNSTSADEDSESKIRWVIPERLVSPEGTLDLRRHLHKMQAAPPCALSTHSDTGTAAASSSGLGAPSSFLAPAPRAAAFQVFRDTLQEMSRMGVEMDPFLRVNPLQVACRFDSVTVPGAAAAALRDETVSIKYMAKPPAGSSKSAPKRKPSVKAEEVKAEGVSQPGAEASGERREACEDDDEGAKRRKLSEESALYLAPQPMQQPPAHVHHLQHAQQLQHHQHMQALPPHAQLQHLQHPQFQHQLQHPHAQPGTLGMASSQMMAMAHVGSAAHSAVMMSSSSGIASTVSGMSDSVGGAGPARSYMEPGAHLSIAAPHPHPYVTTDASWAPSPVVSTGGANAPLRILPQEVDIHPHSHPQPHRLVVLDQQSQTQVGSMALGHPQPHPHGMQIHMGQHPVQYQHSHSQHQHPQHQHPQHQHPHPHHLGGLVTGGAAGSGAAGVGMFASTGPNIGNGPTAGHPYGHVPVADAGRRVGAYYDPAAGPDDPWLPVEDDILICMQNAASDPHFIHTMHWLNNAKGIGRTLPRTTQQAKARYAHLCAVGRKDARLKDQNVIRTIAKLKKSMKQQNRAVASAAGATPTGVAPVGGVPVAGVAVAAVAPVGVEAGAGGTTAPALPTAAPATTITAATAESSTAGVPAAPVDTQPAPSPAPTAV